MVHGAGLVHRDIKPSNVLVTTEGRVVLLDFGLVAHTSSATAPTFSSQVGAVGTVAYMAPEQAMSGSTGPAADWYSVGVLLFEALTGAQPPFGPYRLRRHPAQTEISGAPSRPLRSVRARRSGCAVHGPVENRPGRAPEHAPNLRSARDFRRGCNRARHGPTADKDQRRRTGTIVGGTQHRQLVLATHERPSRSVAYYGRYPQIPEPPGVLDTEAIENLAG